MPARLHTLRPNGDRDLHSVHDRAHRGSDLHHCPQLFQMQLSAKSERPVAMEAPVVNLVRLYPFGTMELTRAAWQTAPIALTKRKQRKLAKPDSARGGSERRTLTAAHLAI